MDMIGNRQVIEHTPDNIFWGDNKWEDGKLKLAAGEKAVDACVLERGEDGNYKLATAESTGALSILANRDEISNDGESAKTVSVRVCIAGRVKKSAVTLGGAELGFAGVDMLRKWGIFAVDATQIGKFDK